MINSIYNPRKKTREPFVFPKITRADATPPHTNKVFARGTSKYNQHNIFKIEDDKKERVKLHIEEDRTRELRQRECDELELKMGCISRRHQEEMRDLEEVTIVVVSKRRRLQMRSMPTRKISTRPSTHSGNSRTRS